MCFRNTNLSKVKIAKKDITVYKVINKDGSGWLKNLRINGRVEKWVRGYQYTETDFPYKEASTIFTRNGFHSNIYKEYAEDKSCPLLGDIIVEMIIPKGTYYYQNLKEYFSQSLIFPHE